MKIQFGKLHKYLASTCRYWHRVRQADGEVVNKLLTATEYTNAVSKVLPRQGTAELLAQAGIGGKRRQDLGGRSERGMRDGGGG